MVDNLLSQQRPKVFGYLEGQMNGKFLVGSEVSLADIGVVSNLINYRYLGFDIDQGAYPKLAKYERGILSLPAFGKALEAEAPLAEQLGLDRKFLS